MNIFLGVDPDLHTLPIAAVDDNGVFVSATIAVSKYVKGVVEQQAVLEMVRVLHDLDYALPGRMMAYAVEAQELYLGKTRDPRNILHLGTVAGAALLRLREYGCLAEAYFPRPAEWKGEVPKDVHGRRILTKAGWGLSDLADAGGQEPYVYPRCPHRGALLGGYDSGRWNKGDWKHLTDAIGLAQWAAEKYRMAQRKAELLGRRLSS